MSFALDPRLAADTVAIGELTLSRALLMKDARYPWVILVPRREGLAELTDLAPVERGLLTEELALTAEIVRQAPGVEKINIGLLGNIVRQLHAHVVGRRVGDLAWPGPVWGAGGRQAYESGALESRRVWLRDRFGAALR